MRGATRRREGVVRSVRSAVQDGEGAQGCKGTKETGEGQEHGALCMLDEEIYVMLVPPQTFKKERLSTPFFEVNVSFIKIKQSQRK